MNPNSFGDLITFILLPARVQNIQLVHKILNKNILVRLSRFTELIHAPQRIICLLYEQSCASTSGQNVNMAQSLTSVRGTMKRTENRTQSAYYARQRMNLFFFFFFQAITFTDHIHEIFMASWSFLYYCHITVLWWFGSLKHICTMTFQFSLKLLFICLLSLEDEPLDNTIPGHSSCASIRQNVPLVVSKYHNLITDLQKTSPKRMNSWVLVSDLSVLVALLLVQTKLKYKPFHLSCTRLILCHKQSHRHKLLPAQTHPALVLRNTWLCNSVFLSTQK